MLVELGTCEYCDMPAVPCLRLRLPGHEIHVCWMCTTAARIEDYDNVFLEHHYGMRDTGRWLERQWTPKGVTNNEAR